jgi:hypothetical protein
MVRRRSLLFLIGDADLAILRAFNYPPMATFRARAISCHTKPYDRGSQMAPLYLIGLSVRLCCFLAPFVEGSQVIPNSGNRIDGRGGESTSRLALD